MKRKILLTLLFLATLAIGAFGGVMGMLWATLEVRGDVADVHLHYMEKYALYLDKVPPSPAVCEDIRKWVSHDLAMSTISVIRYYDTFAIDGSRERLHRLAEKKLNEEMFRCAGTSDPLIGLSWKYAQCLAHTRPESQELKACLDQAATEYETVTKSAQTGG